MILLIDETGDCKKGNRTDYVKRQYIGNVGKKENGIVAVTAYGLVDGMIVPLTFEVYQPRERLKENQEYQSKPQIAARMIRQLQALGFGFELVLADSLDGESKVNFVNVLDELNLPYILAIRSKHALWLPQDQEVYQIEYGLKQAKDTLGWADFRMTSDEQIEKWWELVMSAFLMVSLVADQFNDSCPLAHQQFVHHPWWDNQSGWKNLLNHLRLVIQPLICFNWLKRWLEVFPIVSLQTGFEQLTQKMNTFICPLVHRLNLQLIF